MPQSHPKMATVILISGSGSNLQAIIDAVQQGDLNIEIKAVISNRPNIKGLQRALDAGITAETIDHKTFNSRADFDHALQQRIDHYQPKLLILAGFMRILTPEFVKCYQGRLLNIHPSLLPKYPGLHTHQRALDGQESEHGASIHFVTEALDGGPVILQGRIAVKTDDNAEILAKRVLQLEHKIYPQAIQWFSEGRLELVNQQVLFDKKQLQHPLTLQGKKSPSTIIAPKKASQGHDD